MIISILMGPVYKESQKVGGVRPIQNVSSVNNRAVAATIYEQRWMQSLLSPTGKTIYT